MLTPAAVRYNGSAVLRPLNSMHDRRFDPAQAHRLEEPERLTFMPPEEVIAALGVSPGMMVADIGAGTGYFAIPIATAIGAAGTIYAVDVEPAMLRLLDEKLAAPSAPANIQIVPGEASDTTLASGIFDLALLANVWHEIEDRSAVLREMQRILKSGGRLVVLDWRDDVPARQQGASRTETDPPGPPREHRVAQSAVCAELEGQGWTVMDTAHVGLYSYLVIATRDKKR